jgi:hypothetical protein
MMSTPADVDRLLDLLREAFEGPAWHGPSLRATLRGLDARHAAWRPAPGRHNIWEVVVHAAYWKYGVRRRLTGERGHGFLYAGRNWFVRPGGAAARRADWRRDMNLLHSEHQRLIETVGGFRASTLTRPSRGSRQTPLQMIRGIAAHDLYHAGQIQLLKALSRSRRRAVG